MPFCRVSAECLCSVHQIPRTEVCGCTVYTVCNLKGVEQTDKGRMQLEYELDKPYYEREGTPVKVCSEWSDRLDFGCVNMVKLSWAEDEGEAKRIRVTVQPPLGPQETVIAPVFRIEADSPDYSNVQMNRGYGDWWSCKEQVP